MNRFKESLIATGVFALGTVAIAAACRSQEEYVLPKDCPEGVHTNAAGSIDGFAPNSVVLLYKGKKVHKDVGAVLDKYGACRDTLNVNDIDEEITSNPYVVDSEERDSLFSDLKPLIDGDRLIDVHLDPGL